MATPCVPDRDLGTSPVMTSRGFGRRLTKPPAPPPASPPHPRQVVGRRSMVEFFAQRLGDDGADEEEGGGHGVASALFHPAEAFCSSDTLFSSQSISVLSKSCSSGRP